MKIFVFLSYFGSKHRLWVLTIIFQSTDKKNPVGQDTDGELFHLELQCYKETALLRGSVDCTSF